VEGLKILGISPGKMVSSYFPGGKGSTGIDPEKDDQEWENRNSSAIHSTIPRRKQVGLPA